MRFSTESLLDSLVGRISGLDGVRAAGISGGKTPLPKKGESDIDLFVYCAELPALKDREAALAGLGGGVESPKSGVFEGGNWGSGDFLLLNGVETWVMYFTMRDALREVDTILTGDLPDRLNGGYYPVGRLAMLCGMTALYDPDGFLRDLKNRLAAYPPQLKEKLTGRHLRALGDTEDLRRAAARKDALFYHFALDIALDHFLQALFAMNAVYFPSRKRSLQIIGGFARKPVDCEARLLEAVRLGGSGETVPESLAVWEGLTAELAALRPAAAP